MSFLEDLKKSFGGAVEYTAKKTGEVTGVAKLKMDIHTQNTRLAKAYELIGRSYYKNLKGGEMDDAVITAAVAEADAAKAELSALRVRMAKLQGAVICPACNAQISDKSVYCPLCGVKLPEPAATEETVEDVEMEETADESEASTMETPAEAPASVEEIPTETDDVSDEDEAK